MSATDSLQKTRCSLQVLQTDQLLFSQCAHVPNLCGQGCSTVLDIATHVSRTLPLRNRHLIPTWTRRREPGQLWEHRAVNQDTLDYYAAPGRFTTLGDGDFPSGAIGEVVAVVQGLLVYDVVAQPFYGVELTPIQADAIHERDTARLLDIVRAIDARPLNEHRRAADRIGARCHAFSRLTVAFMRAGGVPARARCGFGAFFRPGWFEDHWVAEYWIATTVRWQMVDAQLDATWREKIGFAGDALAITANEEELWKSTQF